MLPELGGGRASAALPLLDGMLDKYYEARGWDKNSVPTPAKLKESTLHPQSGWYQEAPRIGAS
jgi:aldehyde:ferredoxin oxidoreductase